MPTEPPPSPWRFPDVAGADEHGVVGAGADLAPGTLLEAYRRGIFPMLMLSTAVKTTTCRAAIPRSWLPAGK